MTTHILPNMFVLRREPQIQREHAGPKLISTPIWEMLAGL